MEKAYDAGALIDKLKKEGLDVAEDAAKTLVSCVFDWVAESAVVSDNKIDDVLAPLLPVIKPHVMTMVDKIDGEEG